MLTKKRILCQTLVLHSLSAKHELTVEVAKNFISLSDATIEVQGSLRLKYRCSIEIEELEG